MSSAFRPLSTESRAQKSLWRGFQGGDTIPRATKVRKAKAASIFCGFSLKNRLADPSKNQIRFRTSSSMAAMAIAASLGAAVPFHSKQDSFNESVSTSSKS